MGGSVGKEMAMVWLGSEVVRRARRERRARRARRAWRARKVRWVRRGLEGAEGTETPEGRWVVFLEGKNHVITRCAGGERGVRRARRVQRVGGFVARRCECYSDAGIMERAA